MTKPRTGIAFKLYLGRESVRRYAAFVLLAVVLTSTGAAAAVRELTGPGLAADAAGTGSGTQAVAGEPAAPTAKPGTPAGSPGANLSPDDVYLLARLISGEARGEPFEGQVAVGAVVLNRMRTGQFPRTVAGVVYQPGQFEAAANGQIDLTPTKSAVEAAKAAAAGQDPTGGALYFFDPSRTWSPYLWSRPLKVEIGGHRFTS